MSNNLYKRGYTCIKTEEARVIDTNDLIMQRIGLQKGSRLTPGPTGTDGFSQGLSADILDTIPQEEDCDDNQGMSADTVVGTPEPVPSGPTPEELLEQAIEQINEMKAQADAQIEQERKQILENANEQGYQEGKQRAKQEYDHALTELHNHQKELEEQYDALLNDIEPKMVDTLTDIYEHIFHVELSEYRDLIVYLIAGAMRKTESGRDLIVHVSKEDYPYVSMQKKIITSGVTLATTNVEIIEDITLSKNQAMIETGGGIFDCSLGTQLKELNQKIRLLAYEKPMEDNKGE